jgi:Icc-related predicted phosphoesterase
VRSIGAVQLLLTSDLHYRLPQFDWILAQAADVDVVVLAGDLLDLSSAVPLEAQTLVLQKFVARLAEEATVAVGSGNHDLTSRNSHGEKAADWIEELVEHAVVDWTGVDVDDVRITVCPWWDGPLTRDDLGEFLAKSAEDRPKRWVWVYHSPPDESSVSWAGSRHIGDQQLNQWIDRFQPDLVLAGHIHNSPFVDGGSWLDHIGGCAVLNVGAQPGPIPPHAFLDLTAGTAEWWSSYGRGDALVWSDR